MINRVTLIGRLTHDPELRYTVNGIALTRFNIAVNRNFLNQRGEREADFINIVTWRNLAENCANHLRKGALVGIDGRLQTGKYENKEGRTVYTMDVVAENVQFLQFPAKHQIPENKVHNHNNTDDPGDPFEELDLPF